MTRRLPAEWERHDSTIVAWPTRDEVWGVFKSAAEQEYAALVAAIADDEPVLVVCRAADSERVTRLCSHTNVTFLSHPIDDGWIRDNGPLFVLETKPGCDSERLAVAFGFNSWGSRFSPTVGDLTVRPAIARTLGVRYEDATQDAVLEGGAISANGAGDLLASRESLLTSSRNPALTPEDLTKILSRRLGAKNTIWVPYGLLEDLPNTDGHVDNVAVFVDRHTVLVQIVDEENANHDRLARNVETLRSARLSDGEKLRIVECPLLPYGRQPDGRVQPVPYINFALTNHSVVLPSAGNKKMDEAAADLFGATFPNRQPKFVPAVCLAYGGGGPHCVTMNVPPDPE